MRVHQLTAGLAYGDAVTNHVVEIDTRLKAWGLDSRIYAGNVESCMQAVGLPNYEYEQFLNEEGDLLIYHYSVYASNLGLYKRSRNRKVLVYHNITPPEFFRGYDRNLEAVCRLGRWSLRHLSDCDLALSDSDFNRRELVAAGIRDDGTEVLPIFVNIDGLAMAERNRKLYRRLRNNEGPNILFVGRIAPNKAHEDLIKIVYSYQRYIDSQIHLWLVGHDFLPEYRRFLDALVARLGLEKTVTFTGRVTLEDLRTYYEAADLFLCASRHEGFCVPLLESMHFELPILAYNCTAVPETLGTSGVLFNQYHYAEIAESAHLLVTDTNLRQRVIQRQRQRLADFAPEQVEAKLHKILEQMGIL